MGKFEDNKQYTFDVDSAPISWLNYSEELKEITELIFSNSGTEINRYPEISSNHNLETLIAKIDSILFDKNERKLLSILSKAIPYWGRYPIPKKYTKVSTKFKVNEDLNHLWFKIGRQLYSHIKFGWIGPNGIETRP